MNTSFAGEMKLCKLTLYSSGVGFFEHTKNIDGIEEIIIPIDKDSINDALKSIMIKDSDSSPVITYHSKNTLIRTMQGLSVDLHKNYNLAALLESLRGQEIEIFAPDIIKGRILLVEVCEETVLSLLTDNGVYTIPLKEIRNFRILDDKIKQDVERCLDLIFQSKNENVLNLNIKLPGNISRQVYISYVIPNPIWKVSYRLDISNIKTTLQGWAAIDNDSNIDWEDIQLSLVTGKPVSFVQDLYSPYKPYRPIVPLQIAEIAKAKTYSAGFRPKKSRGSILSQPELDSMLCMMDTEYEDSGEELMVEDLLVSTQLEEDNIPTPLDVPYAKEIGDQFEFTLKNPVTLARQQSIMVPLVDGIIEVEKVLVFSGKDEQTNPTICVEITNTTGMKLPAGPITVYDGGTYAGDALIKFISQDEKRIISYGEDLSVMGHSTRNSESVFEGINIKDGVLKWNSYRIDETRYSFNNASQKTKKLILEHEHRYELLEPLEYKEKTFDAYRFEIKLPPGETVFIVKEKEDIAEQISLRDNFNFAIRASSGNKISDEMEKSLKEAIELNRKVVNEKNRITDLQKTLGVLMSELERTRKNIEVLGSQSEQGRIYVSKLIDQNAKIDELQECISQAEQAQKDAQAVFFDYINNIYFE